MRILVTGGAGFIGSHLAEHLIEYGHHVTAVDDLSTGNLKNLEALRDNPAFRLYISDILKTGKLDWLVGRTDAIVHLAAVVGVKKVIEDPVGTIKINVLGTDHLLDLAVKNKTQVLLASTSEVYGMSRDFPYREDGNIVFGASNISRWGYACSKALDEFLGLACYNSYDLPVTILRFFNTSGPRQIGKYGMVLPNLVQQARHNKPLTVFGDGTQTRCFCHVSDVVRAIASMIPGTGGTHGEVFNVGSEEEISINDLAETIITLTDSSSIVLHVPYEEAYGPGFEDMPRRVPDVTKIYEATKWVPEYTLEDIINSIAEYQEK